MIDALKVLAAVGQVAALVALGVHDYRARRSCEDAGGRVERYNIRTVYVPMSCGKDCTMIVPHEVSDWRCVGAPAHRPCR